MSNPKAAALKHITGLTKGALVMRMKKKRAELDAANAPASVTTPEEPDDTMERLAAIPE